MIDLSSKLVNDNVVHQVNSALIFGLFEHPSGILDDLLGGPDELAIFTLLLGVALPRCHALDLLHATPCTACAVSKVIDPIGKKFSETIDEPRQDAHYIPEQSIIGWMMDIGLVTVVSTRSLLPSSSPRSTAALRTKSLMACMVLG